MPPGDNVPPGDNAPPEDNPPGGQDSPPSGGGNEPTCYYLPKGAQMPQMHRRIIHDSDPVDSYTSLWKGQNFGWSYDVTEVTFVSLHLETKTIEGVADLEEMNVGGPRFLLYKGKSLFNLVRTVSLNGGFGAPTNTVDTWTNVVTSEDGTPDSQQNICCMAPSVVHAITFETMDRTVEDGKFVMRREAIGGDGQPTTLCDTEEVYEVKIRPFPTYTETTVINPLDPMTVWAVVGGALAIIDLFVGVVAGFTSREDGLAIMRREGMGESKIGDAEL